MKKLLFVLIPAFFLTVSCKQKLTDSKSKQPDYSWISDTSKATVYQGPNYLFVVKKGGKPVQVLGEIQSDVATDMAVQHELQTNGLEGHRAFFVEYNSNQFSTYLSNWGGPAGLPTFRIYFGYNNGTHATDPNRYTAMLVGVDRNGNESYLDNVPGLRIVDLGTICPTMCGRAPQDAKAIHRLANLPDPDQ
jgi:hypothetical protein